ncbi:TPX2 (TARGETING PROTEIN FOR XKLP2) PROTEIN FAMILY [Salix viminalis]|uniref:TPX2 (TARGETING PROTEIN FOR XKLP2) PROTEIN FAMILY n=1 Tax=Salix viminalis TaxID=40686 RepID=A0A9Q0U211_SALVM|nr:TPX2 (TARGETING PROTEIN FOR XKLP2) PROTEIN FAMILY [Salix viminalis]
MGESACLLRSFSHPSSASREAEEGNPILALTESISFGRFMSESLAWEKWSTFSHNRFLEEVEQFSKPGSVAQKKAYFEAYYKKRAAMKAAALVEQANTASNDVSEVQAADDAPGSSNVNLEFSKATNDVIINEQDEGIVDAGLVHSSNANALYADGQMDNSQNAKVEGDEVIGEKNVEVENSIHVANSKQIENADDCDIIVAMPEEKMSNKVSNHPNQEAAEIKKVALPNNKRQMSSLSNSSSQSIASKFPKSSARLSTSTRLRAETNATPNSKKSTGQLAGEKGVTSKSIHMSINFASRLQDTSKSSVTVSKDRSAAPENPTRGSVHGVSKLLPSIFQRSQDRRSKSELNKSVSGKNTPVEISQILSSDCSKSSSAKGSKSRPPLISSPFSFRSEERVAKRKEFFQKLGEKNNAKEDTGKKHLHARPKEKAEHDLKKERQSAVFRGKPRDDLHRGLQSPNNSMKKIPLTRPRSPKLGRKSTPNAVQEASLQLRKRASVNAETSKPVIQKSNHSSTCSVTLLPKKKACENASPNTQW